MRKLELMLKEYVSRLSTDNLRYLGDRLTVRGPGDLSDCLEFFSKNQEMDRWLSTAKSAEELFSMVDQTFDVIDRELRRKIPEVA